MIELVSQMVNRNASQSMEGKKYMEYLSQYPEIFSDLVNNSILNFAIYDSIEGMDDGNPLDVFHVSRNEHGIELKSGKADQSDMELALSLVAVQKLTQTKKKTEYIKLFGIFYNDPDEKEGWIDFVLHKRTHTLIDMGYGKFAKEAGILEDED
ncbi:MAG: hypothetical protein ACTSRI_13470 [Promethearchaeota archaeon]